MNRVTTEEETCEAIANSRNNKSGGVDGIRNEYITRSKPVKIKKGTCMYVCIYLYSAIIYSPLYSVALYIVSSLMYIKVSLYLYWLWSNQASVTIGQWA